MVFLLFLGHCDEHGLQKSSKMFSDLHERVCECVALNLEYLPLLTLIVALYS